jgi:hypothetical protein
MTSKIINTATSSNGKTHKRTTKIARFKFALITRGKRSTADFFETEAEAIAKQAVITRNSKTDFMTCVYDDAKVCPFTFEIVSVVHSAK